MFSNCRSQVFTGEPPFPQVRPEAVIGRILRGRRPERPEESRKLGLSDNVWNMVEACWSKDPSLRPTVSEVVTCLNNAVATFFDEVSWYVYLNILLCDSVLMLYCRTFVASSVQKASSTTHPSSPPLLPKLVSVPKHGLSPAPLVSSSSPCMTTSPLQKPNAFLPNGKPTNGLLQESSTTFCPSTSKANFPPHSAASHSQKLDPVAISRSIHVTLGPSQPVNSRTPKASRKPTSVNPKNIPRHRSGDVPTVSKFATLQHDSSVDSFVVVNPTDYQDSQDLPENSRSPRKCIIQ
jgi:Protein tyrosine and serine/threonine kinase